MPNSGQSPARGSPASRRATNFILSSITEHSFQGIAPSPLRRESVTYVSGTMCYLCLRPLSFAERGSAQPEAIVTWFYPGETTGHEFVYPKQMQQELASAKQITVVAGK